MGTSTETGDHDESFPEVNEAGEPRRQAWRERAALGDSYQEMFAQLGWGWSVYEMLYDEQGSPTDWVILEVNQVFEDLIALPRDAIVGEHMSSVLPPDQFKTLHEMFTDVVQSGQPKSSEIYASGKMKYFRIHAYSVGLARFAAVVEDVTERVLAEQRLRNAESRFRKLFEESPIGIAFLDKDREIALTNQSYREFVGLSEEEILKRGPIGILHPDDWQASLDLSNKLRSGEVPVFHMEQRYIRGDGAIAWSDTHITVVRDQDGQLLHTIGWVQDITERKRAEAERASLQQQLAHMQKMESIGRLAGGVAHDFNNMLGVILGHCEVSLEELDPSHPVHQDIVNIRKAATRAADLTRQLLAFARKQTVTPKVLDLNATVDGMLAMVRRLIGENLRLGWRPSTEIWPIEIDPSQIDQILTNLCVNARDAIADVGTITIETGSQLVASADISQPGAPPPGEYVWLRVSDDGCGMDEETQSHVFEPFFTTKATGKGTGLGLATVYGIASQNRGFVELQSRVGAGTRVTVHFPRHQGRSDRNESDPTMVPDVRGSETILLVEDEESLLQVISTGLRKHGYNVLTANTPTQALSLARQHRGSIHLLVTDVIMPEMNGRDLANKVLALHPQTKCVFMSGYTADVIAQQGVLERGVMFVQKPFSERELAIMIRRACG